VGGAGGALSSYTGPTPAQQTTGKTGASSAAPLRGSSPSGGGMSRVGDLGRLVLTKGFDRR